MFQKYCVPYFGGGWLKLECDSWLVLGALTVNSTGIAKMLAYWIFAFALVGTGRTGTSRKTVTTYFPGLAGSN